MIQQALEALDDDVKSSLGIGIENYDETALRFLAEALDIKLDISDPSPSLERQPSRNQMGIDVLDQVRFLFSFTKDFAHRKAMRLCTMQSIHKTQISFGSF